MPQVRRDLVGRAATAPTNTRRRAKIVGLALFGVMAVAGVLSGPGAVDAAASLGGSGYVTVPPARILDTRAGSSLGAEATLDVKVTGRGGVPETGVGAVVLNVTALDQSAPTYLTVFPAGSARPMASNLNPTPGRVQANLVIAKVGANGEVSIYNDNGTIDVIADVQGWFPDRPWRRVSSAGAGANPGDQVSRPDRRRSFQRRRSDRRRSEHSSCRLPVAVACPCRALVPSQ